MQKDRLNILFVSPYLPHSKVGTAGGLLVYNEIKLLAERHNVSLLSFVGQNERQFVQDIAAHCSEIKTVNFLRWYDASTWEKLRLILDRGFKFIGGVLGSSPYPVRKYWSKQFAITLKEWTSNQQFDIVQIEFTQMAQYGRFAEAGAVVLLEHDVSFVPRFRQYWKDRSPLRRLHRRCEWLKMLKHEITVCERFDHVFTLSENDRNTLSAFNPDLRVSAILTGIDLDIIHPVDIQPEKDSIGFMGSFGHRPNVDAVLYFCEKIYPKIKSAKPDVKIYVMGRNEEFLPKLPENFVVTGFLEDVAPTLGKCQVFIAPITWGGGIKVKVLHAMAMGLPVVTTPVGAEGLDVDPGIHLLIDSQPDAFAQHVIDLLDDPNLRHKIGQAGLKKVQEKYGWDAIIHHMESLYYEMLSSR